MVAVIIVTHMQYDFWCSKSLITLRNTDQVISLKELNYHKGLSSEDNPTADAGGYCPSMFCLV